MSSLNMIINTQNNSKEQQNSQNQSSNSQDINNFNTSKTNNNFQKDQEQVLKKNKISYKTLITILLAITAVIGIIILIKVFFFEKQKPIKGSNHGKKISTTKINDIIIKDIIDDIELDDINMNYTEAEKLIGLDSIKENHNILNETLNNINILLSFYNNTNITKINVKINKEPENLKFLIDANESSLKIAENDLDLYISKYSSLSSQANELSNALSEYINNIKLDELKEENIILKEQFEKNIQSLAIVFSTSNSNKLRNLNSDDLKNLIEELNSIYNIFLSKAKEVSEDLISSLKFIIDNINLLNNKINNSILEVNKIIGSITKSTKIHEKLIEIKKISLFLSVYIDDIKSDFNEKKLDISTIEEEMENSNQYKEEENYIIGNISNLILGKKTDKRIEIPELITLIEPTLKFTNNLIIQRSLLESAYQEEINDIRISVVETSTSLDLLFIMDVTVSMEPYIDKVKSDLINIINSIIDESPYIDINLGFVGYRDYDGIFEDIDFMKDQVRFKNIINGIHASGGAYNDSNDKDVAQGLEMALQKSWKSKAKLAIFIADSPANGTKYGSRSKSIHEAERRDLEDIIGDMIKKDIALICVKIKNDTDIMYKNFEDLYNKNNALKNKFKIIENKDISFTTFVKDYAIQLSYEQIINGDDCLLPKKEASKILKSQYGIKNNNPDENLRFILGKCSPVLLVPGLYTPKLNVEFNCTGLTTEEKDTTLKNIRLYCGYNDICKNDKKENEDIALLFSIFGPCGISKLNANNYAACLGHLSTYFQNEKECPKVGNKNICHYSKYVKVGYYGGTTETKKNSKCGVEGIRNIIQTIGLNADNFFTDNFAQPADSFGTISKELNNKNYKEGFSFAALPNDYRRYISTNNFAKEVFKSQINRLYKNTGKPVVIVSHSLGSLVALTNLLLNKDDKEFMKKIKKFLAIAPPFSGASRALDIFFHGTKDFNSLGTDFKLFGQYLMYKSIPVIMELRPKSIAAKIFLDPLYKELGDAIKERLELERYCNNNDCKSNNIGKKTKKFDAIFKGYFPSLLDKECEYEKKIHGNKETFNRKCYTNIYNVGECPIIITKSNKPKKKGYLNDLYCNKYGKGYFYLGECNNKERNCLDEMLYSNKCPNVFSDEKAVKHLIKQFNGKDIYEKIDKNYFDDYETIKAGIKKSIEYQNEIDILKDLPVPPVDTELLYASFNPTITTLILNDEDFTEKGKIFNRGGDETVPTWSSLLTGLKWIYDKKKNNLPQKIKLIEYCSRLAQSGQYVYNPNEDQNFAAISCRCLDKNKNIYTKDTEKCSHSEMLQDENLFNYIFSVINDPKGTINDNLDFKKEVVKNYDPNEAQHIEEKCNEELYNILDTAK